MIRRRWNRWRRHLVSRVVVVHVVERGTTIKASGLAKSERLRIVLLERRDGP